MHAKKSLTPLLSLPFDASAGQAPALPAVFGKVLGPTPHQPEAGSILDTDHAGNSVRTGQSARGAKPGVHVTKTEVPRSGHR